LRNRKWDSYIRKEAHLKLLYRTYTPWEIVQSDGGSHFDNEEVRVECAERLRGGQFSAGAGSRVLTKTWYKIKTIYEEELDENYSARWLRVLRPFRPPKGSSLEFLEAYERELAM
jgi:hypothetical protein